jgi:hypothetical protein
VEDGSRPSGIWCALGILDTLCTDPQLWLITVTAAGSLK